MRVVVVTDKASARTVLVDVAPARQARRVPLVTEGLTVDRSDDRPLYVQVADSIAHQIDGRTLLPGDALPSEAELQRAFGVARSVVRQALARLAADGSVQRSQGRIGIVATPLEWRRQVQRAGGLEQQLAERGQTLTTELVSFEADDAPAEAVRALATSEVWRIERARSVAGTVVAFVRNWVPRDLFPGLSAAALGGASLHELMREAGHAPRDGRRTVQAVPADEYLAGRLDVATGDPLLLLEGITRDADRRGLEWFSVWHRGHTVFEVDAEVVPAEQSDAQAAELHETARRLSAEVAQLNEQLRDLR